MNQDSNKKKVLFICTHNSARSQMAEGLLRAFYSDHYEAYSAGTEPSGLNPDAVKVMAETGIDISRHRSKSLEEFRNMNFDIVITVCDQAKETCPFFPGRKKYIHKNFEDPPVFKGPDDERLPRFRQLRDEIKDWIFKTF